LASAAASFAWAPLVPELLVIDLAKSKQFWCGLCGFGIVFERRDEGFATVEKDGAQIMLEERGHGRNWITAPLDPPLGRGLNIQIIVRDLIPILDALEAAGWPLFMASETKWYRRDAIETHVQQFLVQDPDGYLVRFSMFLGERPAPG
jgi:catechol 2,3-dioxygenase-like lactoylglutathione lyase family enzyme